MAPRRLGREYLRDMGRFLRGESAERPAVPENYFDRATENRLAELRRRRSNPTWPAISDIVTGALPLQSLAQPYRQAVRQLADLGRRHKARRMASRSVHTRRRAS